MNRDYYREARAIAVSLQSCNQPEDAGRILDTIAGMSSTEILMGLRPTLLGLDVPTTRRDIRRAAQALLKGINRALG